VIDDQIHRDHWVDPTRVAAQRREGVAHCGEIDDGGHAREVLHEHTRREEGDLAFGGALVEPCRDGLDVVDLDAASVLMAQQVLQEDLQRHRQTRQVTEHCGRGFEAVILVPPAAGGQGAAGVETVETRLGHDAFPPSR
jgi:hypothetical protein